MHRVAPRVKFFEINIRAMPAPGCSRSQGGPDEVDDVALGLSVAGDGSVVVVGYTGGEWNATLGGGEDFAAFRLDSTGEVLWKFQVGWVCPEKKYVWIHPQLCRRVNMLCENQQYK